MNVITQYGYNAITYSISKTHGEHMKKFRLEIPVIAIFQGSNTVGCGKISGLFIYNPMIGNRC